MLLWQFLYRLELRAKNGILLTNSNGNLCLLDQLIQCCLCFMSRVVLILTATQKWNMTHYAITQVIP